MSASTVFPPTRSPTLDTSSLSSQSPSSFLDRLSTWASENKAIVYTIAGVAVVVSGAGVVYYLSDSRKDAKVDVAEEQRKASKKERRKAKKEKEKVEPEKEPLLVPKEASGTTTLWQHRSRLTIFL